MGEIFIYHEYLILLQANHLHITMPQCMCVIFSGVFLKQSRPFHSSCDLSLESCLNVH